MEPEPLYQEDRQRIEEREAYITAHPEESEHPPEPEEPVELTVEVPRSPSCWRKTQNKVSCVVNSSIFETFITLCILLNTLAMALEHYKMDKVFSKVLENCNLVSDSFGVFSILSDGLQWVCRAQKNRKEVFFVDSDIKPKGWKRII